MTAQDFLCKALRRGIPLEYLRKVERHDRVPVAGRDHQLLVSRIQGYPVDVESRYLFDRNPPARRDVTIIEHAPYGDGVSSGASHNPTLRRDRHLLTARDLSLGSADHTQRRLFSVRSASEYQNGLRQRTVDHDFVMGRVVSDIVHRPADERLLTFERPSRRRIFPRQPGEGRDLRMVHSVRHQILFPLAVVRYRLRLAEFRGFVSHGRAPNRVDRSDVAFGHQGISSGGGITEIRNPELPVLHVERYTGGVYQARLVSFNNTGRRHVALIGRLEHENRLTHIIRYIQIAVLRVQSHGGRPVHLRLRTLNDAYWRDVAIGVQRIDRNRRRMEFTGTGNA